MIAMYICAFYLSYFPLGINAHWTTFPTFVLFMILIGIELGLYAHSFIKWIDKE